MPRRWRHLSKAGEGPPDRLAWLLRGLLALLLVAAACAGGLARAAAATPVARGGVIDLTAPGATAGIHVLRGEWAFDWQQFTDPASNDPLPAFAPVPGTWNDLVTDGKPKGAEGFGTYRLDIRCPAGQQLALSVPAQRTAMRMYVNGRLVASQGLPGASADQSLPAIGRRATLTESFACPLRLTLHLSNYAHRGGGFIRAPVAGPIDLLAPESQQRLALDTILLGAYLVLSVAPLFFFLVRRKEKVALVFGLYSLAQTVYADMTGERLLLQLTTGPETGWEAFLRTEYLSWFCAMALYVLVVEMLFPRTMQRRVVRALVWACAAGALFVAMTPARIYSQFVVYGQAVGVLIGLYVTGCIGRAARQGRNDAGVVLSGLALLLLVLAVNMLQFSSELFQRGITAFGLLVFVLSPALVLLRRLGRALNVEESRSAEQREKVDLLVRATQAGILDWDYSRNLVRYSPRLLEILGYPAGTSTGDWPAFFEHVHPDDRIAVQDLFMNQLRDRSVKDGEMRHEPFEYRLLRQGGEPVWVHAEAISLRGKDGRTLRYICSFLDITAQRAAAEGLKQQNAALAENARLREDVERMSRHDLKTPLNSIIGVTRLLREDPALPPAHHELLAIAERAGYRMLEMVNLSLDLSRMELGTYRFRPQAVNIVDVMARVVLDLRTLADPAGVKVEIAHAPDEPVYVRAEELLCYSILGNLVKNAIEATPSGGTVRLQLETGEPVHVRVRNPSRVPPTVAGRFFEKYVTAGKSSGTGLGTYSARLMARVQHGDVEMQTGEQGTVLTLRLAALGREQLPLLPADADLPEPTGATAAVSAADFRPRRVLLVDDDEYNRVLLRRYLPSPPFTIDDAANGLAATEAMLRAWPDIVLVDLEMPVMNGLEAVAWLRDHEAREGLRPCLVVMMSSNDDVDSIRQGLASGCNRYLTKPFTRETLLATLRELDQGGPSVPMQVPLHLEAQPHGALPEAPVSPEAPVRVDAELAQEVPAFLDSRRKMLDGMAAALAAGDRGQLRALAHRAAGGLALFGFEWAAWQSRRISASAAEGAADALRDDIARLRRHLAEVQVG